MNKQEIPNQDTVVKKPSRRTRIGFIASAGLVATMIAAGIGGVASAQTVIDDAGSAEPAVGALQVVAAQTDDADDDSIVTGSSPEDAAVWQRFEQCLTDAGLNVETESDADGTEPDEADIDAAFDQCDPILDDLSDDFADGDFGDLSAEDEAIFDRYDECLTAGGIDELFAGAEVEGADVDDAAIDALFEQCDPILDELSEQAQEVFGDFEDFGDLSAEDEAIFDRYDECLTAGGADELFAGAEVDGADVDEAAIDGLFEQCDPILDGLSAEAQELFDCPEADEHASEASGERQGADA